MLISLKYFSVCQKNKATGLDGFTTEFFLAAWEIVGPSVTSDVKEFFSSGKLLKQLNSTIIALIPKIPRPTMVSEFRPISCYNIVYKCISKILANRLRACLPSLSGWNQSVFIQDRRIVDKILLAHEIVKDYHRSTRKPRCAT